MIRVANCIHGLGLGGAQQIVRFIVGRADPSQYRFFVYSSLGGVRVDDVKKAGASVEVLPRHLPKFDPLWVRALTRAFRRDRIDIVHTHLFGDSLHGFLAARSAGGIPVVMTVHSVLKQFSFMQQLAYRWLIPRSSRVVACSEMVRESFRAGGIRSSDEMVPIPNGIEVPEDALLESGADDPVRRKLASWSDGPILATIGRLTEAKGYSYLVRAFARLSRSIDTKPRLVLFGEGPLEDQLRSEARREGVAGQVLFAGYRSDVIELLRLVDVIVFSSLWEGLPVALLEAMAARRCIVGTEIPGILEAVRKDREAILVPAQDVAALHEGLRVAVNDPALRDRLGQAARERFDDRFTAERMVSQYEAIYRQVLAGKP